MHWPLSSVHESRIALITNKLKILLDIYAGLIDTTSLEPFIKLHPVLREESHHTYSSCIVNHSDDLHGDE